MMLSRDEGLTIMHEAFAQVNGKKIPWSKTVDHAKSTATQLKCEFCGEEVHHFEVKAGAMQPFVQKGDKFYPLTRDHIIPKSFGGTFARANVRILCEKCNLERGNKFTLAELARVFVASINHRSVRKQYLPLRQVKKASIRLKLHNESRLLDQLRSNGVMIFDN